MPLSLFSVFNFIFILSPAISAGLDTKLGCPDRCGNLSIPYPFGVGASCSLNPNFIISCDDSTDPPTASLPIINKRVFDINESYIRVESLNMFSVCYEHDGNRSYNDGVHINLLETPYELSYKNMLTAIGCDDAVLQTTGSSTDGGCSSFCMDSNGKGGMGYCPSNGTSLGNGCCHAQITGETNTTIGATQLIELSGKLHRKRLFPCSYAFIQEIGNPNATELSYPLYYLDNSTALVNDDWASATRRPVARLDWIAGAQNCRMAKLSDTYACRDEKSMCVDVYSDHTPYHSRGYRCMCVQGYEGNPYLPGGCKTIVFRSSIARPGCPDQCGKLSIPFPFGVGRNCSLGPSFEVFCNNSTNPPIAYLSTLKNVEIIAFISSKVLVKYPNLALTCYSNSSVYGGITKTENRSFVIDLSGTQFTLSDGNWITAVALDDMVVGNMRLANGSFITSMCAALVQNSLIVFSGSYNFGRCPSGGGLSVYLPGNACCRAPIQRGTSYLEANFTDFSDERSPHVNVSCSYAMLQNMDFYNEISPNYYPIAPNNLAEISSNVGLLSQVWDRTVISMDWRIGDVNCNQPTESLACQGNSTCVDFDATVGGYLCNCSEGYRGNPYLPPGCQDIDECADNTTNACNSISICINTPGSYYCSCPKGYYGDGNKYGNGCMHMPPSKTKATILIGMGSGLGFLLLLLVALWLYKVLQKRREKMRKQKFFKRNGGILLRQQTNERTLGQTKVFLAKELEVATDHFNEDRILGHGGQGTVYKGMLSDGKIVAIKKSKLVDEKQVEPFINEVAILSQINHRNVVRLLGCCLETEVPLLVYEFMPNGTLHNLINDPNIEFPFPWSMRLKMATDTAGALAYLHSASSMHIYHRDIKSSNILLDEKYVVKVSDFGISRSISSEQTHLTTQVKGTFGYIDPEYFQSSQFTEKSDVYSFGVILAELLTGQRPISFDRIEEEKGLATRFRRCMEEERLETILDPQVLEHVKKEEVIVVAKLTQRCLNMIGKIRPTMKEVANELESCRMSQTCAGVKDASDDVVGGFEDISTSVSDSAYTWTGCYKSVVVSSPHTHPLMFATY